MRKFLFSLVVSGLAAGVVMAGPPAVGTNGAGQVAVNKAPVPNLSKSTVPNSTSSAPTKPSMPKPSVPSSTTPAQLKLSNPVKVDSIVIHSSGPSKTSGHTYGGDSMPKSGSSNVNYHKTYGKSFSGGYCYEGKSHDHWSYSGYSSKYGCTCYWCPSTSAYYYWSQPSNCYYPVSYYESAPCPPVVVSYPEPAPYCPPEPAPYCPPDPAPYCPPEPVSYYAPAPAPYCPPAPAPYCPPVSSPYQAQKQVQVQKQVQPPTQSPYSNQLRARPAGVPQLPK